jgi:hypothetical protein
MLAVKMANDWINIGAIPMKFATKAIMIKLSPKLRSHNNRRQLTLNT